MSNVQGSRLNCCYYCSLIVHLSPFLCTSTFTHCSALLCGRNFLTGHENQLSTYSLQFAFGTEYSCGLRGLFLLFFTHAGTMSPGLFFWCSPQVPPQTAVEMLQETALKIMLASMAWLATLPWTFWPPVTISPTLASQFARPLMLLNMFFPLGFFLTFSFHWSLCSLSFQHVRSYLACPEHPVIKHSSQGKFLWEHFFYSTSLPQFHPLLRHTHTHILSLWPFPVLLSGFLPSPFHNYYGTRVKRSCLFCKSCSWHSNCHCTCGKIIFNVCSLTLSQSTLCGSL